MITEGNKQKRQSRMTLLCRFNMLREWSDGPR